MEMMRTDHGLIKNDISGDQILGVDSGGSRLSHRSHMRQSTLSCTIIFLITWQVFLICTTSNQL